MLSCDEAIRNARLAKAAGSGNWITIEVINDNNYLLPENMETLKATEVLVNEGFVVFPYMSPDISIARSMAECGAAAVMPLGALIGSNSGLQTKKLVTIMIKEIKR
jgi:thiazole synthase